MRKQLTLLIELQRIDQEVNKLTANKEELPCKKALLEGEMKQFECAAENEKAKLDELQQNYRTKELELQKGMDSLKKIKTRLFEIKTNKEYEAALKEIETINHRNGKIEEDVIMLLDEIETAKELLLERQKELEDYRKNNEKQILALDKDLQSVDHILAEMFVKRESLRIKVSDEWLQKYDMLRVKRNGRAVVSVWKEICSGCHMNIPPQLYNDLQRSEKLILCPNCNRIIYWENRET